MTRRQFLWLLGATIAGLVAARAQQPMLVIGYLSVGSPESDNIPGRLVAFRRGLKEAGYVEGQNVVIEYRWSEGQNDRLPALAADLVRLQVAVIVTPGAPPSLAAKAATPTVPIVFNTGIDPVRSGLVASFNRPGANITGVELLTTELAGKRLELLHELVPTAAVVGLLVNPTNPSNTEEETKSFRDAARSLGLRAHILRASIPSEIDAAFGAAVDLRADGLVVSGDPFFTNRRNQIIALAADRALPAVYNYHEFAAAGGLMSYGADLAESYLHAGILTGKILRGANPADLPVEQVVKVELVLNLKTAKTLGLTIPLTVAGRADEVIE